MKVLIVSGETWADSTNGGNVLTNIFSNSNFEFAQIYCNPAKPSNTLCYKYYQITDSMILKSFFNHKPVGKSFTLNCRDNADNMHQNIEYPNKSFYSFFRKHRLNIFYIAKDLVWNLSNWKNEKLKDFIVDFKPDLIFAPSYGEVFMQRLTRYIAAVSGKKVISYISDDSYTLKQFNISPFYWIRRLYTRKEIRKTFPCYSLVYTMTEVQKKQCEKDFNANMKILLKSIPFGTVPVKTSVGTPIRIVYAGGIYLNRWKTLSLLSDAIKKINEEDIKIIIDIYTTNEVNRCIRKKLNDGVNTFIHHHVNQKQLAEIYRNSDIALHVESFDLKNKLATRMSFSTKIVDCLGSGCAVMAVCDELQGGYKYLKENDVAICISNKKDIEQKLREIVYNQEMIISYAEKARILSRKNHDRNNISKMIKKDFEMYSK